MSSELQFFLILFSECFSSSRENWISGSEFEYCWILFYFQLINRRRRPMSKCHILRQQFSFLSWCVRENVLSEYFSKHFAHILIRNGNVISRNLLVLRKSGCGQGSCNIAITARRIWPRTGHDFAWPLLIFIYFTIKLVFFKKYSFTEVEYNCRNWIDSRMSSIFNSE